MKHDTIAPSPIVRDAPARAPSVHSDASTPFSQAAISGVLVGSTGTLLIGAIIGKTNDGQFTWSDFWLLLIVWGGLSLVVTTVLWFRQLGAAQRTIWAVERLAQMDINQDGATGNPVTWVPINPSTPAPTDRAAETWATFEEFIASAYAEGKTDLRTAKGWGYSEREWTLFMDALEAARMVVRTRRGENAPRRLVPPTADACLKAMRRRGLFVAGGDSVSWVSSGVSSSSSSQ